MRSTGLISIPAASTSARGEECSSRASVARCLKSPALSGLRLHGDLSAAASALALPPPRPRARRRTPAFAAAAGSLQQPDDLPLETAATSGASLLRSQATTATAFLGALYRFTRPHTMLGTFVSVVSVSALALGAAAPTPAAAAALAQALSSALLMNVCIVGINQIYDVEIDRVNKPFLPLPAGDMSPAAAAAIVWATGAASLAVGLAAGSPPLLSTLGGSLLLGIAYSTDVPLLRWKRNPVAAAACILAVRAVLVQLGFFFHMQRALGAVDMVLTGPVLFATAFMFVFSVVIALFKDIPDVAGDAGAGVRTLSVRLGQRRVFWLCVGLLEAAYVGAVAACLTYGTGWAAAAGAAGHALAGALVAWRAAATDLSDSKAIYACYMDVWKAFYAEYLLLPLLG